MQSPRAGFDILDIPAAGAYGVVCIAKEAGSGIDGRVVAIKVLLLDHAKKREQLQRARDEARILSRLHHPNLVRVEPVLEVNGRPVLMMEFIEGLTLEQLVRKHRNGLPAGPALAMVREAAKGLDAAWNQPVGPRAKPLHIVHRDIKPANVMIDVHGQVKVVDFGTARGDFADREAHTDAMMLGTRGYTAPERIEGIDDTPAGDIYALGLVLFELLTGKPMVVSQREDKHDADVRRMLGHLAPEGLSDFVLGRLRRLFILMLRYDHRRRPRAIDVAGALDRLLADAALDADLAAFGRDVVAPLYAGRTRISPLEHPRWDDVKFLEIEPTETSVREINREIAAFVASGQLVKRPGTLAAIVAAHPTSTIEPLLEILDRAAGPKWAFWKKADASDVVLAAMRALEGRRTPPVLDRLRKLTKHPDRRVAERARLMCQNVPLR